MTRSEETVWRSTELSGLAERVRRAERWIDVARGQIDDGSWTPGPDERATAANLITATDQPDSVSPADPVLRRFSYLARWVPILVRRPIATGPATHDTAGKQPYRSSNQTSAPITVTLADILSALRPVIACTQQWHQDYLDSRQQPDPDAMTLLDDVDALMVSFTDVLVRVIVPTERPQNASSPAA